MIKRAFALGLLIAVFAGTPLWAAEYYISPTGNDTTGDGTTGTPWKTLDKVWSSIDAAGDTIILKDGVYNYAGMEFDTGMDKGTSWASSVTIRAENIFKATVTLSGSLDMGCQDGSATDWYTTIQGVVFDYNATKAVCGNYWKFQKCGFMGGGTSVYNENLSVGTNNYGANPGATYGLVEDSFFVGDGGRYQMMIFNSRYVIGRRLVGWMDNTYNDAQGNPAAVFNIYNSEYSWFQNAIAMDVQELADYFQAGLYYTANTNDIPLTGNYSGYAGSMAVNIKEYGIRVDGALNISSATFDNVALIDTTDGISLGGGAQTRSIALRNMTVVSVSTLTTGTDMIGVAEYDAGGTKFVTNSIIANWVNDSVAGSITETYIDCYGNGGTCGGGTGETTVNPRTNGMKYFTRIENGSTLKTAGSGGGQIGAEIQYKIGTTGTLYGDSGWNTLTADSLWPWPYQSDIKERFCSHYSTYGWCSTQYSSYTLTEYLNGYGNSPAYAADTSSPTTPGTPTVTSTGTTTLDISWSASTDDVGVSSYEVDVSTDNFSTFSAGYNDFDMGSGTTEQLTGLTASTTYVFRSRAKDAAGNTSSSSTAGTGTTNAQAQSSSNTLKIQGSITLKGPFTLK